MLKVAIVEDDKEYICEIERQLAQFFDIQTSNFFYKILLGMLYYLTMVGAFVAAGFCIYKTTFWV